MSPGAVGALALAAGALLLASNAFDSTDDSALSRVLNEVTFLGGALLVASLAALAIGSAVRRALAPRGA